MLTRALPLVLVAFAFVGDAAASELIGREADRADLQVNGAGQAHISWSEGGTTRHVVAGNAIDAARPTPASRRSPSSSATARGRSRLQTCGNYDGPPLAWVVVACEAPDGSYWALQRWQRLKPNYGGKSAGWELRLSHWSGPLPVLQVWTDWAYRRFDHLYGRFSYRAGRCTASASRLREARSTTTAAISTWTHRTRATGPAGAARTAFSPSVRTAPSATASTRTRRPAGNGTQYRATVIGPGVTPDVMWQGGHPARSIVRVSCRRTPISVRSSPVAPATGCKPL